MRTSDSILVTGANGLVGSAVSEYLVALGYSNVLSLDRSNCDLRDADRTRYVFEMIRPKYVIHTAARVHGIVGNMSYQAQSYLENTQINTSVVDAARHAGVRKIVAMGTGAIYPYDHPLGVPYSETTIFNGRPHSSESGYAHAKRGMLAMLEAYEATYGTKWAYIVSCNLFGPRDTFDTQNGHVIPSLIRKFRHAFTSNDPVMVWGDGSARRDFLYVKDAVQAIHRVLCNGTGPINMGSGRVYSIRDIVDALADITGLPSERIEWDASMPNGQAFRSYDLSKIKALGFEPIYSLREALTETWEWYLRHPG